MERVRLLYAILLVASICPGSVLAGLEEVEEGVFVDDFEDGMLLDWELAGGTRAEISEGEDGSVLDVRGAGQVTLVDKEFRGFAAEVTIKGGEGGFRFGGRYQAFLTTYFGGSLRISEDRRGELALLKRGYKIGRSYRLKIVSFGPFIGVYVDGKKEFEKTDARPAKGPLTLISGEKGALLDDVRVSTKLPPEEGVLAVPVEEDQALVFSSEKEVQLHIQTANGSARDVKLIAAIRRPKATPVSDPNDPAQTKGRMVVKYGVQYYYTIEVLPGDPVCRADVILKTGNEGAVDVSLGRIPPGSYLLDLSIAWDGKESSHRKCILFVFQDTEPVQYQAPAIPIGTYTHKMPRSMREENPLWWWTYVHATALTLKQYHMNAAVACGAFEPDVVDVLNRYGVAVVERGAAHLDHPGVIGTLLGDEPGSDEMDYYRVQYEELRQKTDKPITTCCVGEGIGLGGKYFFWKETNPKVRAFRWYGYKKHFYGIHHHLMYKGVLPLSDVLRISYTSFDTPYWLLPLSNGGTEHEAYFQFPSPAEHRGTLHLAMAYGARGILFYGLQAGFGVGLVDTVTLEPNGGNLEAIGEVAGHIQRHAGLLRSLEVGQFDVRCASPDIEPVPLHDGKDGWYVYAINRNTVESVPCKLFWPLKLGRTQVKDVFAGVGCPTETDGPFVSLRLDLKPGDGKLLAVAKGN
jgi:hypothetical protein